MTKTHLKPDFCVVGGGSGGLSFAAGASQMGCSVVLLESNKMGGDCLNTGCVPSKALLHAARTVHGIKIGEDFGSSQDFKVDFEKVHAYIHSVISKIAPNDSVERFEGLGVTVLQEKGAFCDPKTFETPTHIIKAKRFVIATGSHPFIPNIPGLSEVPYLTNEAIFDLKELPNHLVVIGGGPIGMEMAQGFHRLGSKVTVLQSGKALPKDEPSHTNSLKEILRGEGIDIRENVTVNSIEKGKDGIKVHCEGQTLNPSHLLVATGRRPNIHGLGLEAANIIYTSSGITVNKGLKTTNPRVYAIGDCIGGYQFTHVAGYHAGLVIRNSIFKMGTKLSTQAIPWVTYTDPELAHVGKLESQLIESKIPYRTLTWDFHENDRAHTSGSTEGGIKAFVTPNGKILGVSILGEHAGELIYPWVIAIQNNLSLSAFTSSIAPYPTLSEVSKRLAGSFYTPSIFSPRMRGLVKLLMKVTS